MNSIGLLLILAGYVFLLFSVAHWAEKRKHSRLVNSPNVYSLALAVYCTAWTYYGSIGVAANSGLSYLPIYIGPVIIVPAWIIILKKIIRISRVSNVSSIADFISLRYGNSRLLGALVTVVCISAILPYIALQLKSISDTFNLVTKTNASNNIFSDTTTYVCISLAIFTSIYGTRNLDASEKRIGITTAVAIESVLKLVFFMVVGIYVTFFVFDGFTDIYQKASVLKDFQQKNSIGGFSQAINWFFLCLVSMFAIFLLPRQFHTAVVENRKEKHVNTAIWLFPLYLLLFNIFVFPIAWGGNIIFNGRGLNADTYSLLIPQYYGNSLMTIMVFLGGFSASISMVVVASIALSTMISNNFLIPYGFIGQLNKVASHNSNIKIVTTRKIVIFLLIIFAYIIYKKVVLDFSLVSIGLISFVIIAQLAPSFFGGLFWRRGTAKGAIISMTVGFVICIYTLLIPYASGMNNGTSDFIQNGLFGIKLLKPLQLFGLNYLQPIPHAFFWSILLNFSLYLLVSITSKENNRERNAAEMFVDIDHYITNHESAFLWKGTAFVSDISKILDRFLGEVRAKRALSLFNTKYNISENEPMADAKFIKFAENLLTGQIGTASAQILISSVTNEEEIAMPEVFKILEESKQNIATNKKLTETSNQLTKISNELQLANIELQKKDAQKDDFLDTITHELRTPITAIRAASEILHDDDDEIPAEIRKQFLQNIISESDRLNRLIDKILDLEKLETGKEKLFLEKQNLTKNITETLLSLKQLISKNYITVSFDTTNDYFALYDHEKIVQVIFNLLSNAIKFCNQQRGLIKINIWKKNDIFLQIDISNNGKMINNNDFDAIFDKFYQAENQNIKKPVGSGLGLAICKQIIELHHGKIWVENLEQFGVKFSFTLLQKKLEI